MSQTVQRAYLSQERVLIQLILSEYTQGYALLYPIVKAVKIKRRKSSELINHGTALFEEIRSVSFQLGGYATKRLFTIPWQCDRGSLEKLERYSYLLVTYSKRYNPLFLLLHQILQKARFTARELLTLLQFWDCRNNLFFDDFDPKHAFSLFDELEELMRQTLDTLVQIVELTKSDENVALCFLKQVESFQEFFGKRHLKSKLKQLFPEGVEHLKQKFRARGFPKELDSLPNKILAEIEAL